MLAAYDALQRKPYYIRWPIKLIVLAGVVFLTLYPSPARLYRHIQHVRNADALCDPGDPALAPVRAEFERYANQNQLNRETPRALSRAIESFVYHRVPYAWDWETWGVADYLPSIAEIVAAGREDCDGRAILAAALLRSYHVDARLAADPRHVWVETPDGTVMGALGQPAFQLVGQRLSVQWDVLLNPAPLAFGVAVFPFGRELIILLTAWALALPPRIPRKVALFVLLALVESLFVLRLAGADPVTPNHTGLLWAAAHWPLAGWILLRHRPVRSPGLIPGTTAGEVLSERSRGLTSAGPTKTDGRPRCADGQPGVPASAG